MKTNNLLKDSRVYLSGPMDFVASRQVEKKYGWRTRISKYLKKHGATVYDPWNKPEVRGLHEYGREDINTINLRETWTFEDTEKGRIARANCGKSFWETMHIDLRMVDISDFIIAYCPTNIYSVGTVHEIVVARSQHKPVLFVSPKVEFNTLTQLDESLKRQPNLKKFLTQLKIELPVKENPKGIPSLWYMSLIGSECFFDGFGFLNPKYKRIIGKQKITNIDLVEKKSKLKRPLLKFLDGLVEGKIPKRWNPIHKSMEVDDDWLLLKESLVK